MSELSTFSKGITCRYEEDIERQTEKDSRNKGTVKKTPTFCFEYRQDLEEKKSDLSGLRTSVRTTSKIVLLYIVSLSSTTKLSLKDLILLLN